MSPNRSSDAFLASSDIKIDRQEPKIHEPEINCPLPQQEGLKGPSHPRRSRSHTRGEVIIYTTVTKYLFEGKISPRDSDPVSDATSPHIGDSDETILRALEELPFSSLQ
jgi:hypothetical protein